MSFSSLTQISRPSALCRPLKTVPRGPEPIGSNFTYRMSISVPFPAGTADALLAAEEAEEAGGSGADGAYELRGSGAGTEWVSRGSGVGSVWVTRGSGAGSSRGLRGRTGGDT